MSETEIGWAEAMRRRFNTLVRRSLARRGIHIDRAERVPQYNLLGLRQFGFKSIIDVGANEGQFARRIRADFPSAAIYCFEPLEQPFARLSEWAKRDGKALVFNVALGEEDATAAMRRHDLHSPSSSFLPTTKLSEEIFPFTAAQQDVVVAVKTLDGVLGELETPPALPVLVKLDVQGYEGRVIRGGRRVLGAAEACIVEVSLAHFYEGQSSFREIFDALESLGLHYAGNLSQVYGKHGEVLYVDAVFVRPRAGTATE